MLVLNDHLISCIEEEASSIWLSNCNRQSETDIVRLQGARVEADRTHLIVYIPLHYGAGILSNLAISDKVTFLTAIIFTYESYQVKGRYLSHWDCNEDEVAFQKAYMEGFTNALAMQALSKEKGFKAYFRQPSIAVRILAEEVYEQTPKKGTGEKLAV